MMTDIILASKSPYRKELLSRLIDNFKCVDSNYDESSLKKQIKDPIELSRQLSYQKAVAVQRKSPKSLIIGSDQVCVFNKEVLSKTGDLELSKEQLLKLQGKTHQLITSYVILYENTNITRTVITELTMRVLSENQVKKYLITDNPIDCAGSYKLEMKGISLFKYIKTEDYTSIIGLPLITLGSDLIKLGVCIPPKA